MGNCFEKPSSSNNFHGEGRTLGSTPAQIPAAPSSSRPVNASSPSNINQAATPRPPNDGSLAAAGLAAQVFRFWSSVWLSPYWRDIQERMAKANTATGKLGQQLADQKKQTRTDTLKSASEEERRLRDAQSAAEARNWNWSYLLPIMMIYLRNCLSMSCHVDLSSCPSDRVVLIAEGI